MSKIMTNGDHWDDMVWCNFDMFSLSHSLVLLVFISTKVQQEVVSKNKYLSQNARFARGAIIMHTAINLNFKFTNLDLIS